MAKKTTKKTARKRTTRKKASSSSVETPPDTIGQKIPIVSLDEILGQSHAVGLLDAAMMSGRVHHAWIFHGPEGVGKFTTALAFAGTVLDPLTARDLSGNLRHDPQSPTVHLLKAGSHPDLHIICKELASSSRNDSVRNSKQTSIAKEVIEEFLVEPATRTRVAGGESIARKVFLVDEAHLLGLEAQNALLKTLEEPPQGTIIVLITPSEDRLLPTIRSRCQRVPFAPLDDTAMHTWIARAQLDLQGIDPAWALEFAGGSPGVLAAIVQSGLVRWHQSLGPALDQLAQGRSVIELGSMLAELVNQAAADSIAGDTRASKDVANRVTARRMFQMLGESFRAALWQAVNAGQTDRAEWAIASIEIVDQAQTQLNSNVALALLFENLAAQCPVAL